MCFHTPFEVIPEVLDWIKIRRVWRKVNNIHSMIVGSISWLGLQYDWDHDPREATNPLHGIIGEQSGPNISNIFFSCWPSRIQVKIPIAPNPLLNIQAKTASHLRCGSVVSHIFGIMPLTSQTPDPYLTMVNHFYLNLITKNRFILPCLCKVMIAHFSQSRERTATLSRGNARGRVLRRQNYYQQVKQ